MRLVVLASFALLSAGLLSGAGPAFSQSRHTICLHEASNGVCSDLIGRSNEQQKRIAQIDNEGQRSVCSAVAQRRFFRDCANQFVARPRKNLACYRVFKGLERNLRASVAKLRAQTRADIRRCE